MGKKTCQDWVAGKKTFARIGLRARRPLPGLGCGQEDLCQDWVVGKKTFAEFILGWPQYLG